MKIVLSKMEPQYSVFIYSKYSSNCKRLNDMIQESKINFSDRLGLQFLCVDNTNIRQRIMGCDNLDIDVVPCILIIFPNGGVEKYEGPHAFRWIETMITRFTPPPPPRPTPPQLVYRQPPPPPQEEDDEEDSAPQPRRKSQRPRMRPIQKPQQKQPQQTSIDDIPTDDEEEDPMGNRHHASRPRARLRKNRGNYEESEGLFDAPLPETRGPSQSALRPKIQQTTANDPTSLMAKADAMRKNRSTIDQMKPVGEQLQNRP